jgi:very-short-patch-repair endonuclease
MKPRNIIIGQKVDLSKILRANELRKKMTPAEGILWRELRTGRSKGFHFRRQQVIDGFIVDFYCHAAGLVIEIDGEVYETQKEYDVEREQILAARGLSILRVKNLEVMEELSRVLNSIAKVCEERTTQET